MKCLSLILLCPLEDFEQDGEESECDPDILNDPINQLDLQVCCPFVLGTLIANS